MLTARSQANGSNVVESKLSDEDRKIVKAILNSMDIDRKKGDLIGVHRKVRQLREFLGIESR